jgi:hypothetical protein
MSNTSKKTGNIAHLVTEEALKSAKTQEMIIITASIIAIVFGLANALAVLSVKMEKEYDEQGKVIEDEEGAIVNALTE